jgi:surface antigen
LLLGGAATYLLSQPRYVERQSVIYQPAPAVAVNPTVGSVLEYSRTGQATVWQDPDTGKTFTTTPVRTHMTSAGPCREYIMSVMIGDQEQQAYGTACRERDGSWKLQR